MPPIKLTKVISVSSEDPIHSASNLLKGDFSSIKWKSKSPGEKKISVTIRFDKLATICSIDVGNENSAFVEILVAKSASDSDNYQVLLPATSLMTLKEAKHSENTNSVKFFNSDDFCEETRDSKWDQVMIVCTQPYNVVTQFGLSFIVFHTNDLEDSPAVPDLGKFHLKPLDQCGSPTIVSVWGLKKKDAFEHKGAAAVTAASRDGNIKLPSAKNAPIVAKVTAISPSGVDETVDDDPLGQSNDDESEEDIDDFLADSGSEFEPDSESDDESITLSDELLSLSPVKIRKKTPKTPKIRKDKVANQTVKQAPLKRAATTSNSASSSKKAKVAAVSAFNARPRPKKPFNQLMSDVVFVISGFQNPLRSDLRTAAVKMGARYKADWDNSCTHLVCAFRNTPKFNQVRGRGKIVKKDWVESCYESRKRLPWRRFALDPSDQGQPESDEEIWEDKGPTLTALDHRKTLNDSSSEEEDIVERQIERIKQLKQKEATKHSVALDMDEPTSNSDNGLSVPSIVQQTAGPSSSGTMEVLNGDEPESNAVVSLQDSNDEMPPDLYSDVPHIPMYFRDYKFIILDDIEEAERIKLKRYILPRLGKVISDVQELTSNLAFCITEDKTRYDEVKIDFPDVIGVLPDWIWLCHDENALQDYKNYILQS